MGVDVKDTETETVRVAVIVTETDVVQLIGYVKPSPTQHEQEVQEVLAVDELYVPLGQIVQLDCPAIE